MNNIQKELSYIGKNLTEIELKENVNVASINSIINLEDNNETVDIDEDYLPLESFSRTELTISDFVNLTININDNNGETNSNTIPVQVQPLDPADLNYDPNDILNEFLEHEKENGKT